MQYLTTLPRLLRATRTFPTTGKLNYMNGPGSRSQQNKMFGRMPGMTVASLKKHYDLIPIVMIIGLAIAYPAVYTARLALRATDVTWTKEKEPYEMWAAKEYKLFNPTNFGTYQNCSEVANSERASTPSPRPNYRD